MTPDRRPSRTRSTPAQPSPDGAAPESLIDLLLADGGVPDRIDGVVVGTLVGLADDGTPRVRFAQRPDPQPARSTVALDASQVGRELALLFEQGDATRPIVMGLMQADARADAGTVDGERIELAADREIVLRCGDASITLTRAGKVLIKGAFVLTDAAGVNRIRGGSVQIN